jgi:hypothetical protein
VELKLYRSADYPTTWFAFSEDTGWVMFPAEVGGWGKRRVACGFDPLAVQEVPISQGFNTGILGASGAEPIHEAIVVMLREGCLSHTATEGDQRLWI